MSILEMAQKAKSASLALQSLSEEMRLTALDSMAKALLNHKALIFIENKKDLDEARNNNLSGALVDRLTLSEKGVSQLAEMCLSVAAQKQVVGTIAESQTRADGLLIQKQRIPLGVIGMIFESRPNVVADGIALAVKSGNAIILKGGKEASHTNKIIFHVLQEATKSVLPEGSMALIETREDVAEMLKLHEYIDLMVPRGGSSLIKFVKAHATMPVVAHDKGLCHTYVHKDAEGDVVSVVLNAKAQRPSACNATETLLLHDSYPNNKEIVDALIKAGVEVHGCDKTRNFNTSVIKATAEDYDTEWLDNKISIRVVNSDSEAIKHIQTHTSHHTEAVLAKNEKVIENFLNSLDASCIVINGSTRFNDGGELGLGAELGISTSKLHAYGPMGAAEMTTTRFIVTGNGHFRK
jgi:glutamate-5-semialdehyde dehydrogenase